MEYHEDMLMARNQFFVHLELNSKELKYPSLKPALDIACSYHEWLSDLIDAHVKLAFKLAVR